MPSVSAAFSSCVLLARPALKLGVAGSFSKLAACQDLDGLDARFEVFRNRPFPLSGDPALNKVWEVYIDNLGSGEVFTAQEGLDLIGSEPADL